MSPFTWRRENTEFSCLRLDFSQYFAKIVQNGGIPQGVDDHAGNVGEPCRRAFCLRSRAHFPLVQAGNG